MCAYIIINPPPWSVFFFFLAIALFSHENQAAWKRPTMLHLLLTTIKKDRRRRRERIVDTGEGRIDLTDSSLREMMTTLMPAQADGSGATCDAWVSAIQKCPW